MGQTKPIIIIGGMGPQASAVALGRLVQSAAKLERSTGIPFPEIIVLSLPVPEFISSPSNINVAKRKVIDEARKSVVFQPCAVMMACNTAHIMFDDISNSLPKLPFISLITAVVREVQRRGVKQLGLLASPTTIQTKLYQTAFEQNGIHCTLPNASEMKRLEQVIRQTIVGANRTDRRRLKDMVNRMLADGCDAVLLGCTELPIVYGQTNDVRIIDSLSILCDRLLDEYKKSAIMDK